VADSAQYSSEWFPIQKVKRKRAEFLLLVKKLAEDQKIELDEQVRRFLSGSYAGSRARTRAASLTHVQSYEKDGVILLDDETDTEEEDDVVIPAGNDDVVPASPGMASKENIAAAEQGPGELPGSFMAVSDDEPILHSVFSARPRVIVDKESEDDFAADLLSP
jgi:hypothetical protein